MKSLRMPITDPVVLLTVDEVCHRLQLSRPSVYRLINSGELSSFTIGRARRIPVEAVSAFIDAQVAAHVAPTGNDAA